MQHPSPRAVATHIETPTAVLLLSALHLGLLFKLAATVQPGPRLLSNITTKSSHVLQSYRVLLLCAETRHGVYYSVIVMLSCFLGFLFIVNKNIYGVNPHPKIVDPGSTILGWGLTLYGVLTVKAKCEAHRKFLIFIGWGCFFPLNRKQVVTAGSQKS